MKVQFAVYHQFLCLCIFVTLLSYGYCRQSTIYHNQFAVHIPKGQDVADEIARKHGFTNHGQ
ncbi:unnamed protein product, partial [Timema podura]|nr:unnamed protein product [Timema podura]